MDSGCSRTSLAEPKWPPLGQQPCEFLASAVDRTPELIHESGRAAAERQAAWIGLHVTEQGIDTGTMEGWAMFGMFSVAGRAAARADRRQRNNGLADPAGQGIDAVRPIRDEVAARGSALLAELVPAGEPMTCAHKDCLGGFAGLILATSVAFSSCSCSCWHSMLRRRI